MNMRYKIKFRRWQFIIFIAFAIFAICIILFTEHGYTPDSYIRIGNIKFQLDYRFYSWGILPALFVIAINLVYHFFAKKIYGISFSLKFVFYGLTFIIFAKQTLYVTYNGQYWVRLLLTWTFLKLMIVAYC